MLKAELFETFPSKCLLLLVFCNIIVDISVNDIQKFYKEF